MLPVGAVLVDFDGTACTSDVVEVLLEEFGDPSWRTLNERLTDGSIGLRECTDRQAELLTGTREEMLAFAIERCPMDPTFAGFVAWAEGRAIPITIVSDGFGFYIEPILEHVGLAHLPVISNELEFDPGPKLRHPNGHPLCVGCGTCKMNAVLRQREVHGPVAFVGDGQSDRYGALYADITFAKDELIDHCVHDGVPFVPWNDFDQVRHTLEATLAVPGPVAPTQCPGWTIPGGGRGIRTLGRVAPPRAFQARPFGRSGRPPPRV
jgi:2-hydroxy-3-keto-5-methylthiopentenyl-1-phosphate phosphatase